MAIKFSDNKIFYTPIYEPSYPIQKETKHGLKDALSKKGVVVECDYMDMLPNSITSAIKAYNPDIVLLQLQDTSKFLYNDINKLKKILPNTKFVNWNGDYHPEILYNDDYIELLKAFDLVGLVTTEVKSDARYIRVNWFYWQVSYEPTLTKPDESTPKHDIIFQGNNCSEARVNLVRHLRKLYTNFGLYGSWQDEFKPDGFTLYDYEASSRLYQNSLLSISDSTKPSAGVVSNRLFQAMSAGGSMVLQQRFANMENMLGFVDGKHLVIWDNEEDLINKIHYYLVYDNKRQTIADCGNKFVLENHSFDKRVEQLWSWL